jgi:hypothetical protein
VTVRGGQATVGTVIPGGGVTTNRDEPHEQRRGR